MMFYIFLAVALLAALTFFFTKNTGSSMTTQVAGRVAQELFVQANLIRAAALECTLAHPEGGGDIHPVGAPDGDNDNDDNPNPPYPLSPSAATNNAVLPVTTYATNDARSLSCLYYDGGAGGTRKQPVFEGAGAQGRLLAPPPAGWPEWQYTNTTDGVSISITPPADGIAAADVLAAKFNLTLCQATWTGSGVFTVWIQKATCP